MSSMRQYPFSIPIMGTGCLKMTCRIHIGMQGYRLETCTTTLLSVMRINKGPKRRRCRILLWSIHQFYSDMQALKAALLTTEARLAHSCSPGSGPAYHQKGHFSGSQSPNSSVWLENPIMHPIPHPVHCWCIVHCYTIISKSYSLCR